MFVLRVCLANEKADEGTMLSFDINPFMPDAWLFFLTCLALPHAQDYLSKV